ncbi:MAG: NUDIX domain-containing protein, partial [Candidatus Diapherotrites archaeon]|nr:NUDIX domain-containing protein [Candidatus Diapherotrites archaeon]
SVRHKQTQAIWHSRRLLAHWFEPQFNHVPMVDPHPSKSGKARHQALRESTRAQGVKNFNAPLVRAGLVPRQPKNVHRTDGTFPLSIPVSETSFFRWYKGRSGHQKERILREKKSMHKDAKMDATQKAARYRKLDQRAHHRLAFNIGINTIIEIGKGRNGEPTHILMLKRGPHVPEAPKYWDLPAGLLRPGENPREVIQERAAKELGLPTKKLIRIGPGLQPTAKDAWFALHRTDKANNYNGVVIHRADMTADEAIRRMEKHLKRQRNDHSKASEFALIPRDPESIRQFLRTHDKTWLPEALRLYGRELQRNKPSDRQIVRWPFMEQRAKQAKKV